MDYYRSDYSAALRRQEDTRTDEGAGQRREEEINKAKDDIDAPADKDKK